MSSGSNPQFETGFVQPSWLKCKEVGCDREAARYYQLCWKHDYLKRCWTNPEFRKKRKATKRIYSRRRLEEVRDRIAKELGGWKCADCGTTDRDIQSSDHKNGGGEAERNRMGGQLPTIRYCLAHLNEARNALRVLCAKLQLERECYQKAWNRNEPGRYVSKEGENGIDRTTWRFEVCKLRRDRPSCLDDRSYRWRWPAPRKGLWLLAHDSLLPYAS